MSNDKISILKAEIKRLKKTISEKTLSLDLMLKHRGFQIYKKEPSDDLVIPGRKHINSYYKKLKKYSFRLFLRDIIKHQKYFTPENVTRYSTKAVVAQYIDYLLDIGIISPLKDGYCVRRKPVSNITRPIKSFGETLEWFICRLVEKEFHAETVRGVKFKRPNVGGDYDLISKIDSSLLYMEIKSSPPKQIYDSEISEFFKRVEDLSPDISIFYIDTELRMKDKIVPMFEDELQRRYKKQIAVKRIVKELFHINNKIFIINSKDSITANMEKVLIFKWHKAFRV